MPYKANNSTPMQLGLEGLKTRPDLAAHIGYITTAWTTIEAYCAMLLTQMLGTNAEPALVIYNTLKANNAQRKALESAAKISLSQEEYQTFERLLERRHRLESTRNIIAHSLWGVSDAYPNALIRYDHIMTADHLIREKSGDTQDRVEIFSEDELISIQERMYKLERDILNFTAGLIGKTLNFKLFTKSGRQLKVKRKRRVRRSPQSKDQSD